MTQTHTATLVISLSLWATISYTNSGVTLGIAGYSARPGRHRRAQSCLCERTHRWYHCCDQSESKELFLPLGPELIQSVSYNRVPECPLCPGHELHPSDLINRLTWPMAGVQGWWGLRVAECGAAF